jgi:hypothetical protein
MRGFGRRRIAATASVYRHAAKRATANTVYQVGMMRIEPHGIGDQSYGSFRLANSGQNDA